MPGTILLQHDWKDYDKRKMREKRSTMMFCCKQPWEARYLASKILQLYPDITIDAVHRQILLCCMDMPQPVAREEFINQVMLKLIR